VFTTGSRKYATDLREIFRIGSLTGMACMIAVKLGCDRSSKDAMATNFFTARFYASAVLAMGLCPSVSVSVCVCLSQAGVLLKRLNVGSQKQHHAIPQGLEHSNSGKKVSIRFDSAI